MPKMAVTAAMLWLGILVFISEGYLDAIKGFVKQQIGDEVETA